MTKAIYEIIAALEGTSSRLEKEKILKENWSLDLLTVLSWTLDPYKPFYFRRIKKVAENGTADIMIPQVWDFLSRLADRSLSGNKAVEEYQQIASLLSPQNEDLLGRILNKDLRAGVQSTTVNKLWPGTVPTFSAMLASQEEENAMKAMLPAIGEPKIDGLRTIVFIPSEKVEDIVFYSRGGKEFETLQSLAAVMIQIFPPGSVVDGETSSGHFQDSISAIKRKTAKADKVITYSAFDLLTMEEFTSRICLRTWESRIKKLDAIVSNDTSGLIKVLERTKINTVEEARELFKKHKAAGYEGTILKDPQAPYQFERSSAWMKMKPLETVDLAIKGYEEGTGRLKGTLGAILVDFEGTDCKVGSGFSDTDRKWYWENQNQLLGEIIEVEFTERTKDGRMRHAVYVKHRTFKGEKA